MTRRRRQGVPALVAVACAAVLVGFATSGPPHSTRPVRRAVVKPAPPGRVRPHAAPLRPSQFLSGVYLLDEARRGLYRAPRHARGSSDIGFAQPQGALSARAMVRGMLRQISLAYGEGHEIGTHYNGHFCSPYPGSVGEWSAADWKQELDQFDKLLFGASANNRLRPAVRLPFGPAEVVGERTPCLQGDLHALFPVLAERGFRYDASRQSLLGAWPRRELGLWEVPLLEIPFVGHTFRVLSMDYNFFANQTISQTPADAVEPQTYLSLWRAFCTSYFGNRAPLSFANHFEMWNGGAYDRALARVVLRACRLPEVRCVSFRELVDWLDAQPRARLRRYRLGRFPLFLPHAPGPPALNRRHTAPSHRLADAQPAAGNP